MRPRALSLLLLLSCLAPTAATSGPVAVAAAEESPRPAFDHYDPVLLNEFAIGSIRQGDLATAGILLERAARLAPHDARIRRNLLELRAYRSGTAAPPDAPSPSVRQGSGPEIPAEPPPLWSPR
jgi:hypothetical protein